MFQHVQGNRMAIVLVAFLNLLRIVKQARHGS